MALTCTLGPLRPRQVDKMKLGSAACLPRPYEKLTKVYAVVMKLFLPEGISYYFPRGQGANKAIFILNPTDTTKLWISANTDAVICTSYVFIT
jgi:hypothetical protein